MNEIPSDERTKSHKRRRSLGGRRIAGVMCVLALTFGAGCASTGAVDESGAAAASEPAPRPIDGQAVLDGTAWASFSDRMKAVGEQVLGEEFPGGPRDRAEGLRHLARTVGMALQWEVDFADPDFPAFYRHNDDVTTWGGPNVDNTYLRTRIRGDQTYRLRGNISTVSNLIISTRNGDMHQLKTGVAGALDRSQLDIDAEGSFEILVGPNVEPGQGIQTEPDTEQLSIRQYFVDWATETPGVFHVERLSDGPTEPATLTPEVIGVRLEAAARWVETSLPFWNAWMVKAYESMPRNELTPPRSVPGGSDAIFYGGGRFELAEDEGLLIEFEPTEGLYYSYQWYSFGWFEPPDFANRQTSLNNAQTHVDDDGRVRIVISARDPGIQNWIDTTGRRQGSIAYRYIWTDSAPAHNVRVVSISELDALLPASTPRLDAEARAEQIEIRRRHIERRFRR